MAAFTQKHNHLQQLIDGSAQGLKMKEAYKEQADAFKILESVHEELMLVLEKNQMETESSYLDMTAEDLSQMDLGGTHVAENKDKDIEKKQKVIES